ncbi:uncharacterized protein LOC109824318 isoform X1 [Asparagus officinalis]|nr:uncharacterized protein LOC109824318 isoform X1 [Asparagus officinalis]
MRADKILLGRVPVNEKLVFWFTNQEFHPADLETRKDPALIRDQTVKSLKNSPQDVIEMVQRADLSSVSLVRVRYRAPWHLLLSNLFKETVTVAGDAMHPMDPAIGQGGCVALEDAVVLARCLAREMRAGSCTLALKRYETERRTRVSVLSMKSYLIGSLFTASWIKRVIYLVIFDKFLGGRFSHTQFDCGSL